MQLMNEHSTQIIRLQKRLLPLINVNIRILGKRNEILNF